MAIIRKCRDMDHDGTTYESAVSARSFSAPSYLLHVSIKSDFSERERRVCKKCLARQLKAFARELSK